MDRDRPDFTIVTPSFNSLKCLPRACASVADQEGVTLEHIVVDGLSGDGTVEWLCGQPRLISHVGKDEGMYDAINRGLRRSRGQILAYLNCDEQYLPGALAAVKDHFAEHPDLDIVCGDVLVVDAEGHLLSFRKVYTPRWQYILASHLYVFSCALFFRRTIVESNFYFDKKYRYVGDFDFMVRLLRAGFRAERVGRYLSAFTITGDNLSVSSRTECRLHRATLPRWARWFRHPLNLARLAEKALSGAYLQKFPIEYSLYDGDLTKRHSYRADRGSSRWPGWSGGSAIG